MNQKQFFTQYIGPIQDDFVPYQNRSYDEGKGGILSYINDGGDRELGDNKFTWPEGRYLWILERLHELKQQGAPSELDEEGLLRQMQGTYGFLTQHSIHGNNICCYLLDRDGNKPEDKRAGRYGASIFVDCFVLIEMMQCTKAVRLKEDLTAVEALYKSIVARIESGKFLTEPYPIPEGYRVHSIPVIVINTTYEHIKMRERFDPPYEQQTAYGLKKVRSILGNLYRGGYIREYVSIDENYEAHLLDYHVNPGHTLEDMWFYAGFLKDYGDFPAYLPRILELTHNTLDIGWNPEYGGLLQFVDRIGGTPKDVLSDNDLKRLIQDTQDMKLWWSHSEALYVFLYLYSFSGEQDLLEWHEKAGVYVFSTLSNKELGGWIQIRKRDGTPEGKLVALPVKDPLHILRSFIKIVELYR